jgi:hypothetical protein
MGAAPPWVLTQDRRTMVSIGGGFTMLRSRPWIIRLALLAAFALAAGAGNKWG